MPVGVVRGRFELDAPALRTLKDLERQGIRTQKQIDALGKSIDRIGDKSDVTRVKRFGQQVADLGSTSERAAKRTDTSFRKMSNTVEREVGKQTAALEAFSAKLDEVGKKRVSPEVDLDGIAQALAQVELLDARLNALGAIRASPRVTVGGGQAVAPQVPGVSVGAPGSSSGGGGMAPIPQGGGGSFGGGRGSQVKSIGLGPVNVGSKAGLAAVGAGLPAVRSLIGAVGALGGSLGYAAAGAGGIGIAGGGGLAAGLAGVISVAKPATAAIKETSKAQDAYNKALAEYGKNSDQARTAKAALDAQMEKAPRGTRQLLRDVQALKSEWQSITKPGQDAFMGLLVQGTNDVRGFAKGAGGRAANRTTQAFAREGKNLSNFATGTQGKRFASTGAGIFDNNIGNFEKSIENSATAFVNVMRAGRPFFREGTEWMERWTRGWADSTDDLQETREGLGRGVESLRQWKNLTGSTWRLLKDIARAGRPDGDSLVGSLTETIDRWDRWIQSNPAKTRAFFTDTVESTKKLASGVASIVSALDRMAASLTPLLDGFSTLVSGAGALGLLTPGAGALAYGAYKGARGGVGGAGGGSAGVGASGAGAAAGGMSGTAMAGLGAAGGLAYAGARRAGAFEALRGRTKSGAFMMGAAGSSPGTGLVKYDPRAARASQLRYSTQGVRAAGGAAAARAGGIARGAGKAFLPVAAIMALLDGAGTEGGIGNKLQGALSGATLGLINKPVTSAARADAASQAVGNFQESKINPLAGTIAGSQQGIGRYNAEIARLRGQEGIGGGRRFLGGGDNKFFGIGLGGKGVSDEQLKQNKERIKLLERERDALKGTNLEQRRARGEQLDASSVEKASKRSGEIKEGFERTSKRRGPEAAARQTTKEVLHQMRVMRVSGRKEMAQSSLEWFNEARKANPKLTGEYRKMAAGVRAQFRRLGKNVHIVNGQILDGSSKEWNGIADTISSAARRGVSETSTEFKRLQEVAIASLKSMGFDTKTAKGLFKGIQAGGKTGRIAESRTEKQAASGNSIPFTQNAGIPDKAKGGRVGNFHATGGRIGGKGLGDTVNAGGAMVAPGELVINRHQEQDANRALARSGETLEGITRKNQRRHDQPMNVGRRKPGTDAFLAKGGAVGMNLMGANPFLAGYAQDASSFGLRVSSGARPGAITSAGNVSNHSRGLAIDLAGPPASMLAFGKHAASSYGSKLSELIYTPMGFAIKNGARVAPYAQADHFDHVHLAANGPMGGGGMAGGGFAGVGGGAGAGIGGAMSMPALKARKSKLGGVPGALANAAVTTNAAALTKNINDALGGGAMAATGALSGGTKGGNLDAWLTQALQITGHFSPENLAALRGRAMQESGGNPNAINNWDSNAKAGMPSQGLLQTIPSTFAAYRDPNVPGGITDPVANAVAAIRYMYGRYGHIVAANGKGYARGGRVQGHDGFIGSFKDGGSFTTRAGKGAFMEVGEGGSREHVSVTPFRPRRKKASGSGGGSGAADAGSVSVTVNMGGVTITSGQDAEEIAEMVGQKVLAAVGGGRDRKLAS